jgi:hypothetical protein
MSMNLFYYTVFILRLFISKYLSITHAGGIYSDSKIHKIIFLHFWSIFLNFPLKKSNGPFVFMSACASIVFLSRLQKIFKDFIQIH